MGQVYVQFAAAIGGNFPDYNIKFDCNTPYTANCEIVGSDITSKTIAFRTASANALIQDTHVSSNKGNKVELSATFTSNGNARCIVRDIHSPRIIPTSDQILYANDVKYAGTRPPILTAVAETEFSQIISQLAPDKVYEGYCVQSGVIGSAITFKTRSYISDDDDIINSPQVDMVGGEWVRFTVKFRQSLPTRCAVLAEHDPEPTPLKLSTALLSMFKAQTTLKLPLVSVQNMS